MAKRALKEYLDVVLTADNPENPLDFSDIFGRSGPVQIEIGSGSGTFILNQAKNHPNNNFIGIEWGSRRYRYSVDRMGRWGLGNVRIIRTDAAVFIAESVSDNSIECFHIYFPDPWPKKRHNKRRFINQVNLEQMLRCLADAGTIRIATDYLEYFEAITELIDGNSDKVERIEFFPTTGASEGEWVGTNFERKYLKEGRKIYTLAVRKII